MTEEPPSDAVAKVMLEALPRASGFYGELIRKDADTLLAALTDAGYVVLPRVLVERAAHYVPNGYGEPSLPLYDQLRASLSAPSAPSRSVARRLERTLADDVRDGLHDQPHP